MYAAVGLVDRGALASPYFLLMTIIFFPAAGASIAALFVPLAWYGGRRGFADAMFLSLCGAVIAGLPTFAVSSFNLANALSSERTDASTVAIMTASMALAGAIAGVTYWLILRPNAYYRKP